MNRRIRGYLGWMVGVLLLTGCGQPATNLQLEGAMLLPNPRALPSFTLQQRDIGDFTLEQLKGKWSMLFFGYTRCPDVCPTELFMLGGMSRQLEQSGGAERPQVLFVSVDSQRDRVADLQEYVTYYHPDFLGITGPKEQIDPFTKSIGVIYERVYYVDGRQVVFNEGDEIPEAAKTTYLINHSATIFLINPDGKLHAVFNTPHKPEVMVRDLAAIQAAWK